MRLIPRFIAFLFWLFCLRLRERLISWLPAPLAAGGAGAGAAAAAAPNIPGAIKNPAGAAGAGAGGRAANQAG